MNRILVVRLAVLTVLIMSTAACTTTQYMKMTPVKGDGQESIYNDGKETLVSKKTHFVTLAPYRKLNNSTGNTSYVLFVQNLGEKPLTISSDNVSISLRTKGNNSFSNSELRTQGSILS